MPKICKILHPLTHPLLDLHLLQLFCGFCNLQLCVLGLLVRC